MQIQTYIELQRLINKLSILEMLFIHFTFNVNTCLTGKL